MSQVVACPAAASSCSPGKGVDALPVTPSCRYIDSYEAQKNAEKAEKKAAKGAAVSDAAGSADGSGADASAEAEEPDEDQAADNRVLELIMSIVCEREADPLVKKSKAANGPLPPPPAPSEQAVSSKSDRERDRERDRDRDREREEYEVRSFGVRGGMDDALHCTEARRSSSSMQTVA